MVLSASLTTPEAGRAPQGAPSPTAPRPLAPDREAPPGERPVLGGAETTAQLVWILAPRLPEAEGTRDEGDV